MYRGACLAPWLSCHGLALAGFPSTGPISSIEAARSSDGTVLATYVGRLLVHGTSRVAAQKVDGHEPSRCPGCHFAPFCYQKFESLQISHGSNFNFSRWPARVMPNRGNVSSEWGALRGGMFLVQYGDHALFTAWIPLFTWNHMLICAGSYHYIRFQAISKPSNFEARA